ARSCYTLRGLSPGGRYLVRSSFYYGNYDALNRLPSFHLYLGVNRWAAVNVTAPDDILIFEAVVVSPADFFQVCLVDIGQGTPFISGLDLRPLRAAMYPEATVNQSLLLLNLRRPAARFALNRYHFWRPASFYKIYRYPFDSYDRIWQSYGDIAAWTNITTTANVDVSKASSFDAPPVVLRSAATPVNGTRLEFSWSPDTSQNNDSSSAAYLLLLYFAELQQLPGNVLRRFDILVDGASWNGSRSYTPKYLSAEVVEQVVVQGSGQHTVSLVATPDAILPPILNAFEIYSLRQMTELATNNGDAKAMMGIRTTYMLKKNWMGDPCAPKAFAWNGLNCSYSSSGPAWITALILSSSLLTGAVDPSFGDLKSLQYLDLSNNSLSGPIPDFLAQMPSLKFLDLSSNKLSGSIPAALVRKRQNGSLVLIHCCCNSRIGNNANICDNGASTCAPNDKQKNRTLIIAIAVPIAVATLLFVAAIIILHRRRIKQDTWMANSARLNSPRDRERSNLFENRQFSYKELKLITANFKEEIGRGGFGAVFLGYLENGSPVAVKIRSKTSSQGDREFLSEERSLSLRPSVGIDVSRLLSTLPMWVRQKLSEGNIESIADSKMGREYDVNSVWKVTELALQCKEQPSRERPTMTDVVAELKECLELEVSRGMGNYNSVTSGTSNLSATSTDSHNDAQANDLKQQSVLELGQVGDASPTHIGPAPR
uniref:Malectin-like domain-containing protein n=1 Tax=Aegilops tauschii subsp. strangulata TaxID=200361 RepID=A0A453JXC5_AEGTS